MASWLAALVKTANNNRPHLPDRRPRALAPRAVAPREELEDEARRAGGARIATSEEGETTRSAAARRRRRRGRHTLQEAGATQGALGDEKTSATAGSSRSRSVLRRSIEGEASGRSASSWTQLKILWICLPVPRRRLRRARQQPEFVGLSLSECARGPNDSIDGGAPRPFL